MIKLASVQGYKKISMYANQLVSQKHRLGAGGHMVILIDVDNAFGKG